MVVVEVGKAEMSAIAKGRGLLDFRSGSESRMDWRQQNI
jgi:hypothetical protein